NRSVPLSRIDPGSVVLVSGGDQSGRAGAALSNPLVFEVRSQAGVPLADVSIIISATNGAVGKTELTTGRDGRASLPGTLGDAAGEAAIVAAVAGLDPLKVTLTVQ